MSCLILARNSSRIPTIRNMAPQSRDDGDGSRPRAPSGPVQGGPEKDLERLEDESSTSAPETNEPTPLDPIVVDWDGPEDPENPLNWPLSSKVAAMGVVSAITFLR